MWFFFLVCDACTTIFCLSEFAYFSLQDTIKSTFYYYMQVILIQNFWKYSGKMYRLIFSRKQIFVNVILSQQQCNMNSLSLCAYHMANLQYHSATKLFYPIYFVTQHSNVVVLLKPQVSGVQILPKNWILFFTKVVFPFRNMSYSMCLLRNMSLAFFKGKYYAS